MLLNRIIQHPLDFTDHDFQVLVSKRIDLKFSDLRQLLTRIFDINENTLSQQSDATTGMLGFMNKWSTKLRQRHYYSLIKGGFRDYNNPGNKHNKVIVAEGDSWFQFPFFIKDIIDWLTDDPKYAVYSIAYGGDWFANILYEEKYIEELSIHLPEVFLISAGGNDFVGSNRVAIMVRNDGQEQMRKPEQLATMLAGEKEEAAIREGYRWVNLPFYSFIWTLKLQYYILFRNLHESGKFKKMQIITQGYDNALPTYKFRWQKWYKLQPLINSILGSGQWLKQPLMLKGISDPEKSKNIIKALIFEINYMFSELAQLFPNVYHIDCRGTARNFDDWFDEIHLHSERFRLIAETYKYCIEQRPLEKVIKAVNFESRIEA